MFNKYNRKRKSTQYHDSEETFQIKRRPWTYSAPFEESSIPKKMTGRRWGVWMNYGSLNRGLEVVVSPCPRARHKLIDDFLKTLLPREPTRHDSPHKTSNSVKVVSDYNRLFRKHKFNQALQNKNEETATRCIEQIVIDVDDDKEDENLTTTTNATYISFSVQIIAKERTDPNIKYNNKPVIDSFVSLAPYVKINNSIDVFKLVSEPVRRCKAYEEPIDLSVKYICQFCLKRYKQQFGLQSHKENLCPLGGNGQPGSLVYRQDEVEIYEVDGAQNQAYCSNLTRLVKVYLKTAKTGLKHAVGFYNYVLLISGEFVGYFSKEKALMHLHSLSVIFVLPWYQKRGLGRLLIAFSHAISKMENQMGTPERSLSKDGTNSFTSFWMEEVIKFISEHGVDDLTIEKLSIGTFIPVTDLLLAFQLRCHVYNTGTGFFLEIPQKLNRRSLNIGVRTTRTVAEKARNSRTSITAMEYFESQSSMKAQYATTEPKLTYYKLQVNCISYVPMKDRCRVMMEQ